MYESGRVFLHLLRGGIHPHHVADFLHCQPNIRVAGTIVVHRVLFQLTFALLSGFRVSCFLICFGSWDGFEAHAVLACVALLVVAGVFVFAIHALVFLIRQVILGVVFL